MFIFLYSLHVIVWTNVENNAFQGWCTLLGKISYREFLLFVLDQGGPPFV
jgi:hypothetical protein